MEHTVERHKIDIADGYFSALFSKHQGDEESTQSDDVEVSVVIEQETNKPRRFRRSLRLAEKWIKSIQLNVEGYRNYDTDKEQALQLFQQAVEADPANINALKHCCFVYRKLERLQEAEEVSKKIKEIRDSTKGNTAFARSLVELAKAGIALTNDWDCHSTFYQNAINLAGDDIDANELAFWKLNLADALMRICLNMETKECWEVFAESVKMYCEIGSSESVDAGEKAEALLKLGAYLHRPGSQKAIPILCESVTKYNILGGSLNPEEYFKNAHALDPASPKVCYSCSLFLTRSKIFTGAEVMIKKTFDNMDKDKPFIEPFAARGEMNLKLYKVDKQKKYIEQARDDLSYFTKHAVSSTIIGQLGSAHYLLLLHDNPKLPIGRDEMAPALAYFDRALALFPDTPYTDIHFYHAQHLADCGYLRLAVESSKRVIENDDGHKNSTFFMCNLMKRLLQLYRDEGRPDWIMSECVYWMDYTCDKYQNLNEDFQRTFGSLYAHDKPGMVRLYHNLLHNNCKETASMFTQLIHNFRPWCPHPSKGYVPPPKPSITHKILHKTFDFMVLHCESDKPWVYYSLMTKLEMQFKLKGCIIGRDIEEDVLTELEASQGIGKATASGRCESSSNDGHDEHEHPASNAGKHGERSKEINVAATSNAGVRTLENKSTPTDATTTGKLTNKAIQTPTDDSAFAKPGEGATQALQFTMDNSACVIIILTNSMIQSAMFQDGKPCWGLQQIVGKGYKVISLQFRW